MQSSQNLAFAGGVTVYTRDRRMNADYIDDISIAMDKVPPCLLCTASLHPVLGLHDHHMARSALQAAAAAQGWPLQLVLWCKRGPQAGGWAVLLMQTPCWIWGILMALWDSLCSCHSQTYTRLVTRPLSSVCHVACTLRPC